MARVKRGSNRRNRRKKILARAKGYFLSKHNCYRLAKEQVDHSMAYAYRDRRQKKRLFRRLWITRIGAAARANGISYSQLMSGLKKANVALDRKVLSQVAMVTPQDFTRLVEKARSALA